jgi:hypothetical protein
MQPEPAPAPTVNTGAAPAPGRQLRILMILQGEFTLKDGGDAESQVRTISLTWSRS